MIPTVREGTLKSEADWYYSIVKRYNITKITKERLIITCPGAGVVAG